MKYYRVVTKLVYNVEYFVKSDKELDSKELESIAPWDEPETYKEFGQDFIEEKIEEMEEHTQETFISYFNQHHKARGFWDADLAEKNIVYDLIPKT